MKKVLFFLIALALLSVSCVQKKTQESKNCSLVYVQGHPHEYLTKLLNGGKWELPQARLTSTTTDTIKPGEVDCWAKSAVNITAPFDSSYLVVQWTNGKRTATGDSILIWGYLRPQGAAVYSVDMLRAVARTDCRLRLRLVGTYRPLECQPPMAGRLVQRLLEFLCEGRADRQLQLFGLGHFVAAAAKQFGGRMGIPNYYEHPLAHIRYERQL